MVSLLLFVIHFIYSEGCEIISILILSLAVRTSTMLAVDFKILPQNINFPGKNCQVQNVVGADVK